MFDSPNPSCSWLFQHCLVFLQFASPTGPRACQHNPWLPSLQAVTQDGLGVMLYINIEVALEKTIWLSEWKCFQLRLSPLHDLPPLSQQFTLGLLGIVDSLNRGAGCWRRVLGQLSRFYSCCLPLAGLMAAASKWGTWRPMREYAEFCWESVLGRDKEVCAGRFWHLEKDRWMERLPPWFPFLPAREYPYLAFLPSEQTPRELTVLQGSGGYMS